MRPSRACRVRSPSCPRRGSSTRAPSRSITSSPFWLRLWGAGSGGSTTSRSGWRRGRSCWSTTGGGAAPGPGGRGRSRSPAGAGDGGSGDGIGSGDGSGAGDGSGSGDGRTGAHRTQAATKRRPRAAATTSGGVRIPWGARPTTAHTAVVTAPTARARSPARTSRRAGRRARGGAPATTTRQVCSTSSPRAGASAAHEPVSGPAPRQARITATRLSAAPAGSGRIAAKIAAPKTRRSSSGGAPPSATARTTAVAPKIRTATWEPGTPGLYASGCASEPVPGRRGVLRPAPVAGIGRSPVPGRRGAVMGRGPGARTWR